MAENSKMKIEASPRPWVLHADGDISDANGDWVGHIDLATESDESFAFRAVNAYDAMAEALEFFRLVGDTGEANLKAAYALRLAKEEK